jgi:anti-sigma regulatory factor (Ser/Thr protein kinase)
VGALLTSRWLAGIAYQPALDDASIALIREAARAVARSQGCDETQVETVALVASELGRNQLRHARAGRVGVRAIVRGATRGVEVIAADEGPGIDASRAFRDQPTAAGSLGAGLGGVMRLADEVDFDVRLGQGSCVRARKFVAPVQRREVTILARPCEGELVAGDDAAAIWDGDALVLVVADGLGHGPLARDAALRGIATAIAEAAQPPEEILARCHAAVAGTRGAVQSVVRLAGGKLSHAGIGNVATHVYSQLREPTQRLVARAGMVGNPQPLGRIRVETMPLPERPMIAMFSDGFSSRFDLAADARAFLDPPLVVARRMLDLYGKSSDDALLLLAR